MAILPLLQNKIGSCFKKSREKFKGSAKTPLFYLAAFLLIFLLGVFIFSSGTAIKSLSLRDFSFLTANTAAKLSSQDLFVQSPRNFLTESPEMIFIQGNSIVRVSPPAAITSQALGSLLIGSEFREEARKEIIEYIVKEGDTLSSVAEEFNISLDTILWANDLSKKSIIKPGQKLIILPVSGILYLVKKDNILGEIAEIYEGEVKEIIAFNELSGEGDIFVGDILIIPGGEMPAKSLSLPQFNIPLANSYFIFPSEGKITQGLHYYNAVDIANQCGKPVVAAASGAVQRAGSIWAGGNRITILHSNGVVTYYGHLSTILVQPGQRVNTGDIIGYIGNTGYTLGSTGCHLHFDVRGAKNFLSRYLLGTYLNWQQ